jgi:hypothetical protein
VVRPNRARKAQLEKYRKAIDATLEVNAEAISLAQSAADAFNAKYPTAPPVRWQDLLHPTELAPLPARPIDRRLA